MAMTAPPPAPVFPGASSPSFAFPAASSSSSRKRAADVAPWTEASPLNAKRRRPNLTNGFSSLSLSHGHAGRPVYHDLDHDHEPDLAHGHDLFDGLEPTRAPVDGDVTVEVVQPRRRRRRSSSTSSSTSADSDTVRPRHRRPVAPVLPDSVEMPTSPAQRLRARTQSGELGLGVEVLDSPLKRKFGTDEGGRKRRREGDMDMDDEDAVEEIPRAHYDQGEGWYEPVKDRIVVTSLSSPTHASRSSRSPTPDGDYDYASHSHLAQPGQQGFTISPSLLTHIMNAQRDQLIPAPSAEKGLVLYRPLGIYPATGSAPSGVGLGLGLQGSAQPRLEESLGRFEELGDDGMDVEPPDHGLQAGMSEGYGPGGGSPWMEQGGMDLDMD
ncbi:hypothetical protein Q5752_000153 [Cryptotrichosporon argae]